MSDGEAYGHKDYWDNRYALKAGQDESSVMGTWEWLGDLRIYLDAVQGELDPAKDRVLVAGCGNSAMPFQLVQQLGFAPERVVAVDYSEICLQRMRAEARRRNLSEISFEHVDVRDMSVYPTGSFDRVIDKATLDTLMCMEDSENAEAYKREVARIIRPGGTWILMTQSESRGGMLEGMRVWDVKQHRILRNREMVELGLDIPAIYQTLFVATRR